MTPDVNCLCGHARKAEAERLRKAWQTQQNLLVKQQAEYDRVDRALTQRNIEAERLRQQVLALENDGMETAAKLGETEEALNAMGLLAKGNGASPTAIVQIMDRLNVR